MRRSTLPNAPHGEHRRDSLPVAGQSPDGLEAAALLPTEQHQSPGEVIASATLAEEVGSQPKVNLEASANSCQPVAGPSSATFPMAAQTSLNHSDLASLVSVQSLLM